MRGLFLSFYFFYICFALYFCSLVGLFIFPFTSLLDGVKLSPAAWMKENAGSLKCWIIMNPQVRFATVTFSFIQADYKLIDQ